jgi:hypothetical protein
MRTAFAILLVIAGLIAVGSAAGATGIGTKVGTSPNPRAIAPPPAEVPQDVPPEVARLLQSDPRLAGPRNGSKLPSTPMPAATNVSPQNSSRPAKEPQAGLLGPVKVKRHPPEGGPQLAGGTDHIWDDELRLTAAERYDYLDYTNGSNVAVGTDGRVHVVWSAYGYEYPYGYAVFYKRYNPGWGWSKDTAVFATSAYSYPAIALDSNGTSVHIVWMDYNSQGAYYLQVYHAQCDPAGSGNGGWNPVAEEVATAGYYIYNYYPSVSCSPGRVHVAWQLEQYDYSTYQYQYAVGYRERIDGTWQDQILLDKTTEYYTRYYPCVAANRNHDVAISWTGYSQDGTWTYGCYGDKRVNGAWTEGVQITSDLTGPQQVPISGLDAAGRWHVAWSGSTPPSGYFRVCYRSQDIASGSWSDVETVSPEDYNAPAKYMALSPDGHVHVVWSCDNYTAIGYRMRDASGNWQPAEEVKPGGTATAWSPSIAADPDGFLHVVWDDTRNGYYNIYYRRTIPRPDNDLACTRIIAPNGIYDKGTQILPKVKLYNFGTNAQSGFPVSVWVDAGGTRVYSETETYTGTLAPGESVDFEFSRPFKADYSGHVTGFTDLSGDERRHNDTAYCDCYAAEFTEDFEDNDGGLVAAPMSGGWAWGTPEDPRSVPHSGTHVWGDVLSGRYLNYASDTLLMGPFKAGIDNPMVGWWSWYVLEYSYDGYSLYYSTDEGATWTLTHAVPGLGRDYDDGWQYTGYHYDDWEMMMHRIPVSSGTRFWLMWMQRTDGSVEYTGAMIDDVAGYGFDYGAVDAGVVRILAPIGLTPLDPMEPTAVVRNHSAQQQSFDVTFTIDCAPRYEKTVHLSLPPHTTQTVEFPTWTPIDGYHTARCQTYLSGDDCPQNDWKALSFWAAPYGWSARAMMPALPSGKQEGAGGWLEYNEGDGLIYAAKGDSTSDFYSYDPHSNVWTILPSIPLGRENKLPGDGCRGLADGNDNIYMTKGNNTLGFWCYTISTRQWTQLEDVPEGKHRIKGGTDLARGFWGSIYLLKGQECEFCEYYPPTGWRQIQDAPGGSDGHWRSGSWLVKLNDFYLYAHRAQTQEMYYNIFGWDWIYDPAPGMPLESQYGDGKLPLGTGGCATVQNSRIYALKGNNTNQFWRFDWSPGQTWVELDTMPRVGPSRKAARVHAGGDIAATDIMFFALKGSKTNELWRYVPYPSENGGGGGQEAASVQPAAKFALNVAPNPMRLGGTISYAVPTAANVSLKLYSITGALTKTVSNGRMQAGRYTANLSAKGLARGVYILKLQSDAGNLTRKVVIE